MTRRTTIALAAAALALASCGDDDGGQDQADHVSNLIDVGVDCGTLFDARQDIDPDDPRLPEINDQLREVGCYSSSSERTDAP